MCRSAVDLDSSRVAAPKRSGWTSAVCWLSLAAKGDLTMATDGNFLARDLTGVARWWLA